MCQVCGQPRSGRAKAFCSPECWQAWQRENIKPSTATAARKRAYGRWRQMVRRCTDPAHHAWVNYGGRGITVCPEWMSFDRWYADIGDAPEGMTLDRIDNDGPYAPWNVRWATPIQQRANQRRDPQASKTECPRGHPYSDENTHVDRRGWRTCRICSRAKTARQRARKKETSGRP